MGFFSGTQAQLANGLSVLFGELYQINFKSVTRFYWDGFGNLDEYGHSWSGSGSFVQRSEIPFGINDDAGELSLTLSGVDAALVQAVRAEESEFVNMPIFIWGQFFDEAMQITDNRFELFRGTMDVPTYGGKSGERSIVVSCEGEWADRNGSKFEFFTNASQLRLFPGDKGLEYVYRYNHNVTRTWPTFD